eukprot:g36840.t1
MIGYSGFAVSRERTWNYVSECLRHKVIFTPDTIWQIIHTYPFESASIRQSQSVKDLLSSPDQLGILNQFAIPQSIPENADLSLLLAKTTLDVSLTSKLFLRLPQKSAVYTMELINQLILNTDARTSDAKFETA